MSNGQLWTTTDGTEARFDQRWGDPYTPHAAEDTPEDHQFVRYWDEIDPVAAPGLVNTMLGVLSVTSPQADGQTYGGKYAVSDVWTESDNKRHVRIMQRLTRVTTITLDVGPDALAQLPTPRITPGTREVAAFGELVTGKVETRILVYKHLAPEAGTRERLLVTASDADWNTVLGAILTGLTIEYRKWEVEPRGDWTGTLTIGAKVQTWAGDVTDGGHDISFAGMNTTVQPDDSEGHQYEVVTEFAGISTATAEAKAISLRDNPSLSNEDGLVFGVEEVSIRKGNEGQSSIIVQKTVQNQTTSGVEKALVKSWGRLPSEITLYWPNISAAAAESLLSTICTTWTSITYEGITYPKLTASIDRHRSGNSTVYVQGSIASGSGGASWATGEEEYFTQEIIVDETAGGDTWRKTVGRKVTSSRTDAYTWANASTAVPPINGHRQVPEGGGVRHNTNLDLYEAFKETWEAGKVAYGDIGS